MDLSLKIKDDAYLEAKFDMQFLIDAITNRIFEPIEYDYRKII